MEIKYCGSQYERLTGREPGDRIVECARTIDHPGPHMQADTGFTWPQVAPSLMRNVDAAVAVARPGDMIVIAFNRVLDREEFYRFFNKINENRPEDIQVLIVDQATIGIVRAVKSEHDD